MAALHGQGGIAGAPGRDLRGQSGHRQGRHAVARHLIYRALEAVHGGHHMVQGRVEELLRSFRDQAADEFGGVLEVSKEDGHLLAFACQGRAGGQDLVGEMGWGVVEAASGTYVGINATAAGRGGAWDEPVGETTGCTSRPYPDQTRDRRPPLVPDGRRAVLF